MESVTPSSVHLVFEAAVSRAVPLALRLKGVLPDRLALASPIGLNPQLVRVRGPASHIQGLDSLPLEPLNLGRVRASGVFDVAVDTLGLGGARVTPPSATVGVRVEEKVERVLTGVPVALQVTSTDPTLTVDPAAVSVVLQGARSLVDAVDPETLRAWVSTDLLHAMVPGEARRVPVEIEGVPDGISAQSTIDVVTVRRASEGRDQSPAGRR